LRLVRAKHFPAVVVGAFRGAAPNAPRADLAPAQKTNIHMSPAAISSVRAGRHDCFDRLVVDTAGPVAGYHVFCTAEPLTDPAGRPFSLRGGVKLAVALRAPPKTSTPGRGSTRRQTAKSWST
jgi:hypothetical protein